MLTGTIPTEIGLQDSLLGLFLYGNPLEGQIPTEIGNLKSLGKLLFYLFDIHLE